MGIRDKPTAPASPWQNGFAERLIGSIRRECVDHFIVLSEEHLRRILRAYARYNTHRSLDKDAPVSRPVQRTGIISHARSSAGFITNMLGFRFSVHTRSEPQLEDPIPQPSSVAPRTAPRPGSASCSISAPRPRTTKSVHAGCAARSGPAPGHRPASVLPLRS